MANKNVVYKIRNTLNNKVYIGQTACSLNTRWSQHKSSAYPGSHAYKSSELSRDLFRYGEEVFEIKVIGRPTNTEALHALETLAIRLFNSLSPNGYNLVTGGLKGRAASAPTKARMSKSAFNRRSKPHTEETKKKISDSNKGKKRPLKTREKMSARKLGIKNYAAQKSVNIIDLTSGFVLSFESQTEAAQSLKVGRTSLNNLILGLSKTVSNRYQVIL